MSFKYLKNNNKKLKIYIKFYNYMKELNTFL